MRVSRSLSVALLVGSIAAQEMRSLQSDYATNAVFDPQRQRVVLCGVGNYSREWDGSAWR